MVATESETIEYRRRVYEANEHISEWHCDEFMYVGVVPMSASWYNREFTSSEQQEINIRKYNDRIALLHFQERVAAASRMLWVIAERNELKAQLEKLRAAIAELL